MLGDDQTVKIILIGGELIELFAKYMSPSTKSVGFSSAIHSIERGIASKGH